MYLLLVILFISFLTEICHCIGYSTLASQAWYWYRRILFAKETAAQQKLKDGLLALKTELRQTTAQDEFARWAKLKRRLDKDMATFDSKTSEQAYAKSAFEIKVTIFMRIFLYGIRTFVLFWYRSSAVFFLPTHWFDPISSFLAYPLAPTGSVSVPIWMYVCHRVCSQSVRTIQQMVQPADTKY
ncbi:GET complex subunit get1 [Dimargaris cristalligena]|nr:GET complex subunit get1 [Dimargaris cristalligena]